MRFVKILCIFEQNIQAVKVRKNSNFSQAESPRKQFFLNRIYSNFKTELVCKILKFDGLKKLIKHKTLNHSQLFHSKIRFAILLSFFMQAIKTLKF